MKFKEANASFFNVSESISLGAPSLLDVSESISLGAPSLLARLVKCSYGNKHIETDILR